MLSKIPALKRGRFLLLVLLAWALLINMASCTGENQDTSVRTPKALTGAFSLINPHQNLPYYYLGNAHNHTVGGCDDYGISCKTLKKEIMDEFAKRRFDFAATTDHDKPNTGSWGESDCPSGMVCFWGTEATTPAPHQVYFGWSKVSVEELCEKRGLFSKELAFKFNDDSKWQNHLYDIQKNISVAAHPEAGGLGVTRNLKDLNPSPHSSTVFFDALEINETSQFDYWGWALRARVEAKGKMTDEPFWGVTSTDYHPPDNNDVTTMDVARWLMVNSDLPLGSSIVYDNIKNGNFFAINRLDNPTGIKYLQKPKIAVNTVGADISVDTDLPSNIRFYDVDGHLRQETLAAASATYSVNGDEMYIRVVVDQRLDGALLRIHSQPIAIQYPDGSFYKDLIWLVPLIAGN